MLSDERKMIKWRPFDSVISSNKMVKEVLKERQKIKRPILSEEQKKLLENKIVIAFYTNDMVNVSYFNNGEIKNFKDKIKKIDSIYNKIYFYNHIVLFDQILEVL